MDVSWSRFCHTAVGMMGVVGTFSLPEHYVIPRADSCTIVCTDRQRHLYELSVTSFVMAGDWDDELHSKSRSQSAGITFLPRFMRTFPNFAVILSANQYKTFVRKSIRPFSPIFPRVLRRFSYFAATLHLFSMFHRAGASLNKTRCALW